MQEATNSNQGLFYSQNKMAVLTLLPLVLLAVCGNSRHVSQTGLVNADITELGGALLAANEGSLTPEAQRIISGKQTENANGRNTDHLNQRLFQEEQESMLVAGLYLDQRREDTAKSSSQSSPSQIARHNVHPKTPQVPPGSSHLPTPKFSSSMVTSPNIAISFLEDLVAEVLPTPKHKSTTLEVENGHRVKPELQSTQTEDGTREENTSIGPGESVFTYNAQAAMLKPTEAQATNVTQNTTVKSVVKENQTKAIKAPSKSVTKKEVKRVDSKAPAKTNRKTVTKKIEEKKMVNMTKNELQHFPYFEDNYCPPECACYGRVVQCSDKGVDKVPYGIPYNSRYVLLMNNHIDRIQLDLLNEYASMEFLVLTNNRLTDGTIEGAFEGVPALKRLYLDRNLLQSTPGDLPVSLEELRLDNNQVNSMSEAAWTQCPGLLVLSMSNNSLGNGSESLPNAVLSPLCKLQTLNLDHNQLTTVPLGLPLSIKEMYLKGNRIEQFRGGAFNGKSQLVVLDLSGNRLKGLLKDSLLNATHLESLNLEGNRLTQIPQHLPKTLKTLNLEGNLITAIKKTAFGALKNLEHLGLARNKIYKVAVGAFRTLPALHQVDLGHNALRQVPRQLPQSLHLVALTHNRIQAVPRDAFCWGNNSLSGLVRVQLQNNVIDMDSLDTQAFRCLRGFQVVHFY